PHRQGRVQAGASAEAPGRERRQLRRRRLRNPQRLPPSARHRCSTDTKRRDQMVDAVIVSTARTPIGKAYRGAFNDTDGHALGGHAIAHALKRSGLDGGEIEDVVMGCAMQEGTTGLNVARRALLSAGLPVTVAGTTIDRQCSSGMQAMALLANAIRNDGVTAGIAGGLESISLVQNDHRNTFKLFDETLKGPA